MKQARGGAARLCWVLLGQSSPKELAEGPPHTSATATAGRGGPLAQSGGPQLQVCCARGCCSLTNKLPCTAISDTVRSTATRPFCRSVKAQRACHSQNTKHRSAFSILSPRPSVGLVLYQQPASCFVRAGFADELLPASFTQPLQKGHSRKNGGQ